MFVIESSFFVFFCTTYGCEQSVENTQEQGRGVMAQGPTNPTFSQGSGLVTYLNSVCVHCPTV